MQSFLGKTKNTIFCTQVIIKIEILMMQIITLFPRFPDCIFSICLTVDWVLSKKNDMVTILSYLITNSTSADASLIPFYTQSCITEYKSCVSVKVQEISWSVILNCFQSYTHYLWQGNHFGLINIQPYLPRQFPLNRLQCFH